MPKYSIASRSKLDTCHKDLQHVFNYVIRYFDCTIVEGHRGEEKQNKAFKEGKSKLKYPKSKHNRLPSMAVDVVPYPIDWKDHARMRYFAGWVVAVGRMMYDVGSNTHLIRHGGDWDKDTQVNDQSFIDLPHFELYKPKK